jgi:Arc/MetJ-type ribon-helix-helix transcriptional regulator
MNEGKERKMKLITLYLTDTQQNKINKLIDQDLFANKCEAIRHFINIGLMLHNQNYGLEIKTIEKRPKKVPLGNIYYKKTEEY